MKRKLICALLMALSVGSITACGSKNNSATEGTSAENTTNAIQEVVTDAVHGIGEAASDIGHGIGEAVSKAGNVFDGDSTMATR